MSLHGTGVRFRYSKWCEGLMPLPTGVYVECDDCGATAKVPTWDTNGGAISWLQGPDGWLAEATAEPDYCPACAPKHTVPKEGA